MDLKQAREHLQPANFDRYRELGGKLPERSYRCAAAHFLWFTFDIYVLGDPVRYESRGAAWDAFDAWLQKRYPGASTACIFQSLDDVNAYT